MRRSVLWFIVCLCIVPIGLSSCKNPQLSGAILHFDQGRFERARETLLTAAGQEPDNAEIYLWLGKTYAELDSTQLAVDNLKKASQMAGDLHPEMVEEVKNALEHYWSVRHNEGLSAAQAAQEANALGNEEEAAGHFRHARNQFQRAQIYDPTREETPRNLGAVYFNLGEVDSGLAALKASRELAGSDNELASKLLFDQYRYLGDQATGRRTASGDIDPEGLADAIEFYREAEQMRPDDADLLFSIGVVYYQRANLDSAGRTEMLTQAVQYFDKALVVSPDDQEALYNAASLHLELKTCDEGLVLARRLLDLSPRDGRNHDLVGRMLDCKGEKTQRVAGLVFSRALTSGEVVVQEEYRTLREKWGAQSDLVRKYREEGDPDEVRIFTDTDGGQYVAWFYWARGKAIAFYDGERRYETSFKPQQLDEE